MFDPFWDFARMWKAESKSRQISWDLGPLFRDFWVLGLRNRYGYVGPWFYPFLCPFCNV
jgi:hypothetical protein